MRNHNPFVSYKAKLHMLINHLIFEYRTETSLTVTSLQNENLIINKISRILNYSDRLIIPNLKRIQINSKKFKVNQKNVFRRVISLSG